MIHRTRMALVGALSATALVLTGCGGQGEEERNQDSQQSESSGQQAESSGDGDSAGRQGDADEAGDEGADESGEAGGSEGNSTDAEVTPPGTALKLGEQAVLPIEKDGKEHLIGMTVTAIEEGDQKALRESFGDRAEGFTPYYLQYEVENLDGADLSYTSAPRVDGMLSGGERTSANASGELPGCETESAPGEFTEAGATYTSCELEVSDDEVVAEVHFDEDDYRDDPVVWTS